ncbi:VOC family protein [Patulibacter minatonensis]|uniref:VOC family protein n=1 Tax=Patulibacter minatonensis TaxID=298163 RepID=UPI000479EBBF|nr:VOC family protein [Patulibacter minatonensis]
MSTENQHPAGVPRRVDTMQPDPRAAADHYAALFGWTFDHPVPMPGGLPGEHRTARLDGRPVAGVGQAPPGAPAVWTTWIAVDDVAATVDRAVTAGGDVLLAPAGDAPGTAARGGPDADPGAAPVVAAHRVAVVTDPTGVAFGLLTADGFDGTERADAPGAWTMSSLHTPDPDGARAFYDAVVGWRANPVPGAPMAFWRAHPEGEVLGVLAPIGPGDPTPPHWSVCFRVADVDALAVRAVGLGGTVLMGPVDTPGFRSAVLADPQGGVIAVTCPA